jgi:hypothetical protein
MTPVFQKVIDKEHGDCMQATVASLFDLSIENVPEFIKLGGEWFDSMSSIYKDKGYSLCCFNPRKNIERTKEVLKADKGVGGYWAASVASVHFGDGVTHSVIIDENMNVVHDPNPNNKNHIYFSEDILSIDVCGTSDWYIDIDGKLIIN